MRGPCSNLNDVSIYRDMHLTLIQLRNREPCSCGFRHGFIVLCIIVSGRVTVLPNNLKYQDGCQDLQGRYSKQIRDLDRWRGSALYLYHLEKPDWVE